jgi:hypothetical protein
MKHTVDESYLKPNRRLSICIKRQSMTRQLIVLGVLTIYYPSQKFMKNELQKTILRILSYSRRHDAA